MDGMVLPTNSAALFDRLRCRSRERRRDPVGFRPSLSLNSLARSIESTQEYVRDPGAYRPATYYQLYASRFTARICFDATLWSIGHSLPRDDEAQSSAGSHIFFSKQRALHATYACQWCHDRLWVKLISTRKPLCCEADSEVGSAIIGRTKWLWLCPWSGKKKVIIIWNLKVGAKSKR